MFKRIIGLFITGTIFCNASGQNNYNSSDPNLSLVNIIPSSPNAANLGAYGNTPVSYYTGTSNVSIPLFQASSGNLSVPIALSYNSGGIKVEDISSWVGLGWNLNTGGIITRSVRGTPDDMTNGFMNQPMKVKFMLDHGLDQAYTTQIKEYLRQAGKGTYDTEPDMFYFNCGGVSGKFYYDQEANEFYTIPRMNVKIAFNSDKEFALTLENGSIYTFATREYTNSQSFCTSPGNGAQAPLPLPTPVSGWLLTTIENADKTDVITFSYTDNNYSYQMNGSSTKYFLKSMYGEALQPPPEMGPENCYSQIAISGKKLTQINFRGGYLKFNAITQRCDLPGTEMLDNIELYSSANELVKSYKFEYGYFGDADQPLNCNNAAAATGRRLKLKKIKEVKLINATEISIPPYAFEYNESTIVPGRLSYAQDYWGYSNGANNNQSLVPPLVIFPNTSTSSGTPSIIRVDGADRHVNHAANQMASLTKIVYPTGGNTLFEYESNMVNDNSLEPEFVWEFAHVEGNHDGGASGQTYFESAPFTINEPKSILNGNNEAGGMIGLVTFAEIGNCNYGTPGTPATSCAVLTIVPVNTNNAAAGPFSYNTTTYLANGTYKLVASFQQPPRNFDDFYFEIKWKKMAPSNYNGDRPAGGIRIKKTIDYDGVNHSNDVVKLFTYNTDNGTSSGKIFGNPLNYTTEYTQKFYSTYCGTSAGCINSILNRTFYKQNSFSNYPLLTSSGSYVGYSNVTIHNGNITDPIGNTKLKFRNDVGDILWNTFPYPVLSNDWRRGDLIEEKQYENQNGNMQLVSKTTNDYVLNTSPSPVTVHKSSVGFKVGFNYAVISTYGEPAAEIFASSIPTGEEYETNTDFERSSGTTTIIYDKTNPAINLKQQKQVEYNFVNFQAYKVKETNSTQQQASTIITYPVDYSNVPAGHFIKNLIVRNALGTPVEKYTVKKGNDGLDYVIAGTLVTYKSNQLLVNKTYILDIANPILLSAFTPSYFTAGGTFTFDNRYKEQLVFSQYDIYQNPVERQKYNDVKEVYLWGYNAVYPVAKLVNTTYDIAKTYITQSILDNPADDASLRTHLNNLRNIPGALVSTYTYKPLVGLTSETNPNGRTNYYEYDKFNRLVVIKDHDKNVIKKICYNFNGQVEDCTTPTFTNDQQQAVFTNNSCTAGLIAPTYTHTVPVGTYTASNKEDANQLAIAAMNTNGQAAANALPCLAALNGWNKTSLPWNVTVTGTSVTFNATYSFYPGSGAALFSNIPAGTYNINFAPMYAGSVTSPVQLLLNGSTYNGTSFNLTAVSINAATTVAMQNAPATGPCSFTVASGYSSPTSSLSNNGTTVTGYLVFYPTSTMSQGFSYLVGTVNGGCRPSVTRYFNCSSGGRNWQITVYPTGEMYMQIGYGSTSLNAYSTASISPISYNL